jgi:hypothetical protein
MPCGESHGDVEEPSAAPGVELSSGGSDVSATPGTGMTSPGMKRGWQPATAQGGAALRAPSGSRPGTPTPPTPGRVLRVPPGTCPGTPTPPTPGCALKVPPGTWPGTPTPPTPGVVLRVPPGSPPPAEEPVPCPQALLAKARAPASTTSMRSVIGPREARCASSRQRGGPSPRRHVVERPCNLRRQPARRERRGRGEEPVAPAWDDDGLTCHEPGVARLSHFPRFHHP